MTDMTDRRSRPRKGALSTALAQRLTNDIASGEFPVGSRLPSEIEFARQLDVSRSTLREALTLLEREGLILRRQRAGTTVQARPVVPHPLQRNYSVREVIEASGKTHGIRDAEIRFVNASASVANELGLEEGAAIVVLARTRTADAKPVIRTIDHLDAEIVARATAPLLPDRSFYEWMHEHCGLDVAYGVAHITSAVAEGQLVDQLEVSPGTALLRLSQVDYVASGRPVLHSIEFHVAEAFHVTVVRDGPYTAS
jgi:GntR family transcriptional regulator